MSALPWQADVLDDWLTFDRSGRWSASTTGLAVPRQNGKNAVIEIREVFGMALLGEKFLHTAHEVKTARKAFRRLLSFFDSEMGAPAELAALVQEIRKTNGQEAITLSNGGSVEFIARSRGSGRGYTVDVLVCDEAQELSDDELAALLPTISAAPLGDPQLIVTGTPPDPERVTRGQGEAFARIRRDGEQGRDKRLAWTDYGVADGPLPDSTDRAALESANPSLGSLLNMREVERELATLSPEYFARERLGYWGDPDQAAGTAFGEGRWEACFVDGLQLGRVQAIGVAVSMDRSHGSIAAAGLDDETLQVGAVEQRDGVGWLVAEAKRLQETYSCAVVVDSRGPAADLVPALEAVGLQLVTLQTSDVLDATASLFDRVQTGRVAHPGHDSLDAAVRAAKKRNVGDRWTFGRRQSSADISMLEAAMIAGHAVTSQLGSVYDSREVLVL